MLMCGVVLLFYEFVLHPQCLQDLIAEEPAAKQNCAAAAQQHYNHSDDNDGIVIFSGFVGDHGGQWVVNWVVHNGISLNKIMIRWIISGSFFVGASVEPPDNEGRQYHHERANEDWQNNGEDG